ERGDQVAGRNFRHGFDNLGNSVFPPDIVDEIAGKAKADDQHHIGEYLLFRHCPSAPPVWDETAAEAVWFPAGDARQRRQWSFSSRRFCRFQSRSFSVSRLSCSFLPLASASSSFALPFSLK